MNDTYSCDPDACNCDCHPDAMPCDWCMSFGDEEDDE